jgi:hypothetical protein
MQVNHHEQAELIDHQYKSYTTILPYYFALLAHHSKRQLPVCVLRTSLRNWLPASCSPGPPLLLLSAAVRLPASTNFYFFIQLRPHPETYGAHTEDYIYTLDLPPATFSASLFDVEDSRFW